MLNPIQIQARIQIRPMEMVSMMEFHLESLGRRRRTEPRKVVRARKTLPARRQQPEAVGETFRISGAEAPLRMFSDFILSLPNNSARLATGFPPRNSGKREPTDAGK